MYVKVILKGCHHSKYRQKKYYDVTRYLRVNSVNELFTTYPKLSGVKKGKGSLLSFEKIPKEEYLEGMKNQRKDLYVNYNRDNHYREKVMFSEG